jgi:arsenate reductase
VPESVKQYEKDSWNLVVTVCDKAKEICPTFPRSVSRLHILFDDPAFAQGTEEERRAAFRRVRDEIRERLVDAVRKHG